MGQHLTADLQGRRGEAKAVYRWVFPVQTHMRAHTPGPLSWVGGL